MTQYQKKKVEGRDEDEDEDEEQRRDHVVVDEGALPQVHRLYSKGLR